MPRKLIYILLLVLVLFSTSILAYIYLPGILNTSKINSKNVELVFSLPEKKVEISNKDAFGEYLGSINFWGAKVPVVNENGSVSSPVSYVTPTSLEINFLTEGRGRGNYYSKTTGEVFLSSSFSVDNKGKVVITHFIDKGYLADANPDAVDKIITEATMGLLNIIRSGKALTSEEVQAFENLSRKFLENKANIFLKISNSKSFRLINYLYKDAKAGCLGGTLSCGHQNFYQTCGGSPTGTDCSSGGDTFCASLGLASCQSYTTCSGEWSGSCSIADQAHCSTSQICLAYACVADGSCYWSGGTPPPPAPSCDCGNQQCDYSVPNCKCLYIGCKVGDVNGDSCVKYSCNSNPPPPPPPVNDPKGYHDGASCDNTWGWACDADDYNASLAIHFYANGPAGTGTFIGSTTANVARPDLAGVCGGTINHGFQFIPDLTNPTNYFLSDGNPHTIYAYAINVGATGNNVLLPSSPLTMTCNSTCTISFNSPSYNLVIGGTPVTAGTNISVAYGVITRVDFSSSNTGIATVTSPDTTNPFTTSINAVGGGTTTANARAYISNSARSCPGTAQVIVAYPDAWWQVKDADVMTNGSLASSVPTSLYFNLIGNGGFPGVSIYSDSTNLTNANVAETKKWLAKTTNVSKKYKSDYFINAIPSTVNINNLTSSTFDQTALNGGTPSGDYTWFVYDATGTGFDLNISTLSLGTKKAILIVKGAGINITGKINRTPGSGFFLAVATGDINVDPAVGGGTTTPDLEGIFVTDGSFYSGTIGNKTDSRLWIKGSVIAYGGFGLQRDLGAGNTTTPGELFEYAPDLEFLFPASLAAHNTTWREIAP